jgi:hypothetical protein
MDVENESLSSKLDWIENTIRAQKKELSKSKHYMTSMRQELANDNIDGFEVSYFQLSLSAMPSRNLYQSCSSSRYRKFTRQ